ncbi:hypothetical protein AB0I60_02650 [Actinosynnema sp. NPDC050436]|uniref:hypothetical protein n=1 Tax=Actinosynnema sp. NPDC050436 TaxID=3155659 RepID=UPI0033FE9D31
MRQIVKRAVIAALAAIPVMAALPAATATAAPLPINRVSCNRDDFLWVYAHQRGPQFIHCYANGGTAHYPGGTWLDRIWTGNNRVQWFGDGRWQPATPIGKNTDFRFPNHPGGVRMEAIRIV